jgi:tetratricopeptide (TPR) repeat protein
MRLVPEILRVFPRRTAVFTLLAVFLVAGQPQRTTAQMNMSGATMGTQDQVPPDQLPVPQRMRGIGNVHMQITATPEAQMWFDQGLNLIHDFWDYESARAFEQSVRVDAQCAMCYWGLYKAESFYHATSRGYAGQALAKAISLKGHANKHERLYIEASAAYEDAVKNAKPIPNFSQEMQLLRKLVKKYPKDTQGRIFLALSLEDGFDADGEPRAGQKNALAMFESVMKDDPENSAANHYYIHALEASAHPEQALHSAEILASLAPASGHMVHMPGHIFFRVGDYARAERAFAASMQVDERYIQEQHVKPDNDWNYVHNLMYAIANLMEEGKLKDATALSTKLTGARGELESTLYVYQPRDSISRIDPRLPVALRTANWAQVLELSKTSGPPATQPNLRFLARQLCDFAAGMQAVDSSDLAKGEESSARFDAEQWRMSQQLRGSSGMSAMAANNASGSPPKLQVMPDALLEPILSSLSVMSLELRASLLTARQQTTQAKGLFAQAAQEEKRLAYREPPAYIRPVGETEAAALLAVGDWAGAREAYERALIERPRSGFPLYGIALSDEKARNPDAAAKEYAAFLAAWKDADPALTQVTHAQGYVAVHPAVAGGAERSKKGRVAARPPCQRLCSNAVTGN